MVPCRLGGVNTGPRRTRFSTASAAACSRGVRSVASSSVVPCGSSGGSPTGTGCVGQDSSPDTSLFGTTALLDGPDRLA